MISRFNGLNKELLNLKDVIIKDIQIEKQGLRKKVKDLESKITSLKTNHNSWEQCGIRNNIEITDIPDGIPDWDLEQRIVEILKKLNVMYHTAIWKQVIV